MRAECNSNPRSSFHRHRPKPHLEIGLYNRSVFAVDFSKLADFVVVQVGFSMARSSGFTRRNGSVTWKSCCFKTFWPVGRRTRRVRPAMITSNGHS